MTAAAQPLTGAPCEAKVSCCVLIIVSILYGMYLRISEIIETSRWQPKMGHFFKDNDGNWWFKTVGKGNKERHIAVSDALLEALKRYRHYLGFSSLPTSGETIPLLPKIKGEGGIQAVRYVRELVQICFNEAIVSLREKGHHEDADALNEATVHWLRHTGISEDVKTRPLEHVRDDAGHSSSLITDKYIDITRRERHATAVKKALKIDEITD